MITILLIILTYIRYKNFVMKHSLLLRRLEEINQRYNFDEIENFKISNYYDNIDFYENISTKDFLIYSLIDIQDEVNEKISKVIGNINLLEDYKQEIERINYSSIYDKKTFKIKKILSFIEQKLYNKMIKNPDIEFYIKVVLYLTNINGEIQEYKIKIFDIEELEELIYMLNDKYKERYNNRNIWDAICRVERGIVTNRLRFKIYERDNYRCCKCGRTTDDLEIDHIIPISKGGKSTENNLQTLCRSCNLEKSNR